MLIKTIDPSRSFASGPWSQRRVIEKFLSGSSQLPAPAPWHL